MPRARSMQITSAGARSPSRAWIFRPRMLCLGAGETFCVTGSSFFPLESVQTILMLTSAMFFSKRRAKEKRYTSASMAVKKRVQVFHWRPEEAGALIALLEKGGFSVGYDPVRPQAGVRMMAEDGAFAAVIDLSRMPSYGRYWAAEIRGRKKLRRLPIVFVNGDGVREERIRMTIPDGLFASSKDLVKVLRSAKPLADPVVPPRTSIASDRPVAGKLGIKAGARVAVFDPPVGYLKLIGTLPDGAALEEEPQETLPLTLWFVREEDGFLAALRGMRRLAGAGSKVWVIYPKLQKGQRGGLNQNLIRESANAVGMVDYKICSVDGVWSGMLFTSKK